MLEMFPEYIKPGTLGKITNKAGETPDDPAQDNAAMGAFLRGNKNRGCPTLRFGATAVVIGRPKDNPAKVIVALQYGWALFDQENVRKPAEE